MQSPIRTVNFTNMSRSGWTWHNLLTINFKYKYCHNFGRGFIFKCISLHNWKNKKRLLKNVFVKLPYLCHDLIIEPPCRTAPSPPPIPPAINCPPSAMKSFYKKVSPYFMGDIMPLVHWKIMWGYMLPQYWQGNADI